MRKTRRVAVAVGALIVVPLAGCAWQSEALKLGDDLYEVSATASPARGGATGARRMALRNAAEHCESLGKAVRVIEVEAELSTFYPPQNTATVTFECVDAGQEAETQP